jgi:iron complex outermembrane receptor protein
MVNTGEVGVRGKFDTGSIKHNLVVSGSAFQLNTKMPILWIQKIH